MTIQGNNPVVDRLLNGNDAIVYNLVAFIREQSGARLHTDGRSYLTAQTNFNCPMWVYVNAQADTRTEKELLAVFSEAIEENARLSINAQEGFTEKILSLFSAQHCLKLLKRKPLNVYFIRKIREVAPVGKLVVAEERYEKEIAKLIQQATVDDGDGELTDEDAMEFAKANANTGNLFLWRKENLVVSMARVVRYGGKYARLTSVVTERAARGNAYAKMLLGEVSKRLLAEGLTPVLYARSENPSSNSCYQNLGFEKAGEVCEFTIEKYI